MTQVLTLYLLRAEPRIETGNFIAASNLSTFVAVPI